MKKTLTLLFIAAFLMAFSLIISNEVYASTIIIDASTDVFGPVGDFSVVAGNSQKAGSGTVEQVLKLNAGGNSTISGSNTLQMKDLYNALQSGGILSTSVLVFGFDVDETGAGGDPADITSLSIKFAGTPTPSGLIEYSLKGNIVSVDGYNPGNGWAEALFRVDLGFDFMSQYNSLSSDNFTISSDLINVSNGFGNNRGRRCVESIDTA